MILAASGAAVMWAAVAFYLRVRKHIKEVAKPSSADAEQEEETSFPT